MATKRPPEFYLQYWEQAEKEEFGVEVITEPDDVALLVNALYDCRKVLVGRFQNLIICQPKPEGTVFITHKAVELPE